MTVRAHWNFGFKKLSLLWIKLAKYWGQMRFPRNKEHLTTRIQSINSIIDSRKDVRAWIRSYNNSTETIYAAFYSTHSISNFNYMNIAFPFQLGNLTSILYFETISKQEIIITTKSQPNFSGHEGIYFVRGNNYFRLPLNETIRVKADPMSENSKLYAIHSIWIFGIKFLSLEYEIFKKKISQTMKNLLHAHKVSSILFSNSFTRFFFLLLFFVI